MNNSNSHKHWKLIVKALLSAVASAATVSVASAATLPDQLESTAERRNFRQLADSELAGIRGRYVQGSNVLLFGMEMSTIWTTPTGDVFETRAQLGVDLSGASPSVSFTPHITATNDEAYQTLTGRSDHQAVVVDSGSRNATGLVQVIQAGGDSNLAGNDFQLDINHDRGNASTTGNGETQLNSVSGVQMSIQGGAMGLGMQITVPGQGKVAQGVYSGRGLHQSVQMTGSHQQVQNMTRMQVRMDRGIGGSSTSAELRRALQSARGLGRNY